ncbi:ATP-dependent Clp protease ATP-binding subunit [Candidatus Peregrinibacteria bacterium]|nr:MAG: ATP-dependent Clp protease ATP-binding subunit [Candidatus Peregrinibacteria bacterium]
MPEPQKGSDSTRKEEIKTSPPPNSLRAIDEFFSNSIRRILIFSNEEARNAEAVDIDTEHVLLGMIRNAKQDQVLKQIFEGLKIDLEELEGAARKEVRTGKNKNPDKFLPFSVRTKNVLLESDAERRKWRHHATAGEHLLIALTKGDGVAVNILKKFGLTAEVVSQEVENVVGMGQKKDVLIGEGTPLLDQFGIDMCQQAREGKIDPVIGRAEEIERTIHILARRRKNNPLLIGDPGVGKTAIVEGLANRIVRGDVPEVLKGKRIISLSINSLVAGASHRGDFEQRMEGVIKEAVKSNGEVILFIDEIHTLISAESAGDAAQILKPPLARGEIHCIGATTTAEHHQFIENDPAFSRRFQQVIVPEPSFDETFQIIQGSRDKYEAFHKVKISDDIIRLAILLSNRFIADRFLPDKAFDLIDEAAAMARMPSISTPEKEKDMEKEIEKLRAERERAKGVVNIEELTRLEQEINEKTRQLEEIRSHFEEEKSRSHDEIKPEHIAQVVSRWSGIPLNHIAGSEASRLLSLEDVLHQRLIGQDYAVKIVASAVRRGRSGIRKPKRPIGSFLFMGPSGVGKTEFAKTLAEMLFGKEEAVIRFDMSEFMEKHAVARLTGPPPGYVGYEKGGELTEAVRKNPYSIVLLDEVEKAHPDVFHILLQILDDGRLTDNHGRLISFKHTIIICTSNLSSEIITKEYAIYWQQLENMKEFQRAEQKRAEKGIREQEAKDEQLRKEQEIKKIEVNASDESDRNLPQKEDTKPFFPAQESPENPPESPSPELGNDFWEGLTDEKQ